MIKHFIHALLVAAALLLTGQAAGIEPVEAERVTITLVEVAER